MFNSKDQTRRSLPFYQFFHKLSKETQLTTTESSSLLEASWNIYRIRLMPWIFLGYSGYAFLLKRSCSTTAPRSSKTNLQTASPSIWLPPLKVPSATFHGYYRRWRSNWRLFTLNWSDNKVIRHASQILHQVRGYPPHVSHQPLSTSSEVILFVHWSSFKWCTKAL